MRNKKISEFDKLADFLDCDEPITSSAESLKRLDEAIAFQLERANKAGKKSWMARARKERTEFESSIQGLLGRLSDKFGSRAELIRAIETGVLGDGARSKLQLQFRNRNVDELSDADLMAIIGDQEILQRLKLLDAKKKP